MDQVCRPYGDDFDVMLHSHFDQQAIGHDVFPGSQNIDEFAFTINRYRPKRLRAGALKLDAQSITSSRGKVLRVNEL